MHSVRSFALATLLPAGLIALGGAFGGVWIWAAFAYMTLVAWALDKIIAIVGGGSAVADPDTDPTRSDQLSVALAVVHFVLLGVTVQALAAGGAGAATWIGLFAAAGLWFGQVSNANAHDLIHRTDKRLFALGKWIYISLLFGHHTSAHLKVHHRFAASAEDPNSAPAGESFYAFAPRAWQGSFRKGYEMERADIMRRGTGGATPYVAYVFGAAGFLLLAGLASGWAGMAVYLGLAAYAQVQLLLSDFVQHYGLTRARRADGTLEPIGPGHSWNADAWFTGYLLLNAPRHSDHHTHPSRPYPGLALPDTTRAPRLPASLPVMSVLALYPAGWRRVMDRALSRRAEEVHA